MGLKKWSICECDKEAAKLLSEECGINDFVALLLTIRGIDDPFSAEEFLSDEYDFQSPFDFTDMDKAVSRINSALEIGEKIAIFGDYDCDGITSTAVLYTYLVSAGADVIYRLPTRDEGYGLDNLAVEELGRCGISLIITVDNGVSAAAAVERANELGIDVVVTDHHIPPQTLPNAVAVVDPKREDEICEFKDYAGVGVAFMLVCALSGCSCEEMLNEYGDLVALGTIADVMPVVSDNRGFIKYGLRLIKQKSRASIAALIEAASLNEKKVDLQLVSFGLAPRLNAAGRMLTPDRALQLILCDDKSEALTLARELNELNLQRQKLESDIVAEAEEQIFKDEKALMRPVLVVHGDGWHQGVLGLISAKLSRKYDRPCITLSTDGDTAVGSARSYKGVSIHELLSRCKDILLAFGGHETAAGLKIATDKIDDFIARINIEAHALLPVLPYDELKICCKLNPEKLNTQYVNLQNTLAPFGNGNEQPVYGLFDMRIISVSPVGNGNHLRLLVARGKKQFSVMKFFTRAEQFPYSTGDTVDLAVTLEINHFAGGENLSVVVCDVKPSEIDNEQLIKQTRIYENYRTFSEIPEITPPCRDDIAAVYRIIRERRRIFATKDALLHILCSEDYFKTRIILDILKESGLINLAEREFIEISILPSNKKVDLQKTATYQRLEKEVSR